MTTNLDVALFIDPPSEHYLDDRLFDVSNAWLNRDGTLAPYARLRDQLAARGVTLHTADFLFDGRVEARASHYWSMGLLRSHSILNRPGIRQRGFILFEPPLVSPKTYARLPMLTKAFEEVYVHNTIGDGYSLAGVDQGRLRKLFWPQPYNNVDTVWYRTQDRSERIVAISGYHKPRSGSSEHYSTRIEAVAELAQIKAVDLYGRGWDKPGFRGSLWLPYLKNSRLIKDSYRGSCESKMDVLAQYKYALCFENMSMTGYVTEKIVDCFYAGTVPLYIGPPDAQALLPPETYIDAAGFGSWTDMFRYVQSLSDREWNAYRDAARSFIEGLSFERYFNSLARIVTP